MEIVATVSAPEEEDISVNEARSEKRRSSLKAERSFSISESVSTAALQLPKFFKKLTVRLIIKLKFYNRTS